MEDVKALEVELNSLKEYENVLKDKLMKEEYDLSKLHILTAISDTILMEINIKIKLKEVSQNV